MCFEVYVIASLTAVYCIILCVCLRAGLFVGCVCSSYRKW